MHSCHFAHFKDQLYLKPEALFGVNLFFAGELFAQAPVSQYPGSVVEAVTDSSRYFVIRIEDGTGKAGELTHTKILVLMCLHS